MLRQGVITGFQRPDGRVTPFFIDDATAARNRGRLLFLGVCDRAAREKAAAPTSPTTVGRGLFAFNRQVVTDAENGGCTLFDAPALVDETTGEAPQAIAYQHCVS